jgi:hypothetical protein
MLDFLRGDMAMLVATRSIQSRMDAMLAEGVASGLLALR